MLYKERARGMVSDDIQMTFTVNRAAWIGDDLSGSMPHATLRSVFSNKNMTFLLSVSDCWCRRWLSTWVWITRFGGLVRAAVRRWWWWWWRHNCRHKKPKISEEKLESEPPVVKKRRFPFAGESVRWGYNPIHYVKWISKIAEDPQFYVDNVDTMTLICYEVPYKHWEMLQMTQNFPFSPQKEQKKEFYIIYIYI